LIHAGPFLQRHNLSSIKFSATGTLNEKAQLTGDFFMKNWVSGKFFPSRSNLHQHLFDAWVVGLEPLHRSPGGHALTMLIDQILHTVPLRSLIPVITGCNRKENKK